MMDDDDDDDDNNDDHKNDDDRENDDDYKCLRDFIRVHQLPMLQLPGSYCNA